MHAGIYHQIRIMSIALVCVLVILLCIITITNAQTNALASDKNPDFDANGIVGYADFFLFAPAYQKTPNQPEYSVVFDLNSDTYINFNDFLIFASYFGKKVEPAIGIKRNCKEIVAGFNGPVETRINLVFLFFNYNNIHEPLDKIKIITNPDVAARSLFDYEPLASNVDKFNLWYVEYGEHTTYNPTNADPFPDRSITDFDTKWKTLADNCAIPGNVKIITTIFNTGGLSPVIESTHSTEEALQKGYMGVIRLANSTLDDSGATLLHELTHVLGRLGEEYVGSEIGQTKNPGYINCNTSTAQTACPQWCSGPPVPIEQFKQETCNTYNFSSCIFKYVQGSPCFALSGDGAVGESLSCINLIDVCTSISTKNECLDTKNNFYQSPLCAWIADDLGIHPYYKSKCIPANDNLNIGTQCREGTGCYNGCTFGGIFRSEKQGAMRQLGLPLGNYNEKILCDRIREETGSVGGKCTELFQLFQ